MYIYSHAFEKLTIQNPCHLIMTFPIKKPHALYPMIHAPPAIKITIGRFLWGVLDGGSGLCKGASETGK